MSSGWLFLGAMIMAYGAANLLQSIAAARTASQASLNVKLLLKLVRHRTYVLGVAGQFGGFILAVLARRDLPLFLVQASVAAGLGVTAILGVFLLNWRLPGPEIVLLGGLVLGLAGLVLAAQPHPSRQVGTTGVIMLVGALGGVAVLALFGAKLSGVPGSVVLGSLAGVSFGAAAVASRPLGNLHSVATVVTDPLLYLLVAHSLVGQLLLGLAMQRGSTTAAVAAMDAAAAVPAAVVGLLFLGDRITPGLEWLAGLGFVATLGAVIGLTFFAEPQYHHRIAGRHRVNGPPVSGQHSRAARRAALLCRPPEAATPAAESSHPYRQPVRSQPVSAQPDTPPPPPVYALRSATMTGTPVGDGSGSGTTRPSR